MSESPKVANVSHQPAHCACARLDKNDAATMENMKKYLAFMSVSLLRAHFPAAARPGGLGTNPDGMAELGLNLTVRRTYASSDANRVDPKAA
jgi:hypothetical protein